MILGGATVSFHLGSCGKVSQLLHQGCELHLGVNTAVFEMIVAVIFIKTTFAEETLSISV